MIERELEKAPWCGKRIARLGFLIGLGWCDCRVGGVKDQRPRAARLDAIVVRKGIVRVSRLKSRAWLSSHAIFSPGDMASHVAVAVWGRNTLSMACLAASKAAGKGVKGRPLAGGRGMSSGGVARERTCR
jgi:hypothetical protein